jgi:ribonucleoside-diphosphate reductase alpha chain
LLAINLYGYVENPFTKEAHFNFDTFKKHAAYAQRLMDDIIDLELEKIDAILGKIHSDPEDPEIKRVERRLWEQIRIKTEEGRRTGIGITAEGDMLAALGIRYGSDDGIDFAVEVHKTLALEAYRGSVNLAKERGAFTIYDPSLERGNPFIERLKKEDETLYRDMQKYGRRNIALLTIAPTGTTSLMTQTSSGIEPAFALYYKRRRTVNPSDVDAVVAYTDPKGISYEEYMLFHHKFLDWLKLNGYNVKEVMNYNDEQMRELIEKSPYNKATSADVDWLNKVRMQGEIQKWVDHSISVTINLPEEVSEDMVAQLYITAWKSGCKGITVYREGSREGILVSAKKDTPAADTTPSPRRRPASLDAEVIRFKNNREDWIAFIGLYEGRPYEIFTGITADDVLVIPKAITKGKILKVMDDDGKKRYDFQYEDRRGYTNTVGGLSYMFAPEYWNYAKFISSVLRFGMPIQDVVNLVSSLHLNDESINTWKNGVERSLKKYIPDGTKVTKGNKCPECGVEGTLMYKEGCLTCSNCAYSKCG